MKYQKQNRMHLFRVLTLWSSLTNVGCDESDDVGHVVWIVRRLQTLA